MAGAVFLSYASQDAEAARRIADALQAGGVEVWFDRSELRGGDAWDQKIRRQIRDCALFLPVISAATQARREGYFRREWKLAVERTHDMADGTPFLVPVAIDDTKERDALVPDVFLNVQWTRLANGETPEAFVRHVRTLLGESAAAAGGGTARAAQVPAVLQTTGAQGTFAPSASPGSGSPNPAARRRRLWTLGALGAIGAAVAAALLHRSGSPAAPHPHPDVAQPTAEMPPPAPPAAARVMTAAPGESDPTLARAMQLIEALNCPPENVRVAEDLCRAAMATHPTDPAAAVALARVQTYYLMRGFDTSDARFADARTAA